jgi:hypothetical protein
MTNSKLNIIVNHQLTLDAGQWEPVVDGEQTVCLIHPPQKPLFKQVVDYLSAQVARSVDVPFRHETLVLTNLCLRWGSYLALLTDHNKPIHPLTSDPTKSHITDEEMKRINIEASSALAFWLDLRRKDYQHYMALINCASELLPITPRRLKGQPEGGYFASTFRMAEENPELIEVDDEINSQIKLYPARAFANALLNYSWRNGSGVENIHAGRHYPTSLSFRRIRSSDERALLNSTTLKLIEGLYVIDRLPGEYDWSQIALPYYSPGALLFLITPFEWTFTEETCPVRLFETECV